MRRKTLDESEWSSCAKSGEISFLQSQIAQENGETTASGSATGNGEEVSQSLVSLSIQVRKTRRCQETLKKRLKLFFPSLNIVPRNISHPCLKVRELKTELERRESALSEAEQSRKSLQTEISSLKRLLQQSSSASSSSDSPRSPQNNLGDEGDDEDEEDRRSTSSQQKQVMVSFIYCSIMSIV